VEAHREEHVNAAPPPARVLVTGVSGQDGWYLARRLLTQGLEVHGVVRDRSVGALLEDQLPGLRTHLADLQDDRALTAAVEECRPDQVYNLAGSTSVARSWQAPVESADVIGVGAVRLLSAAWQLQERTGRPVRFLQASSAEVFGDPAAVPQSEQTPHVPVTPYGAAKDFAHTMVQVYRRRGMFAAAAILYNHESPRRPASFVARKITRAVAAIARGDGDQLTLGNIDVLRDWGYAPDHVAGLVTIMSAAEADDYIVATGEARSVRDFVQAAFEVVGITDWESYVTIDPALYRPADPRALVGDASRLRALGWRPSVGFHELVSIMVEADLESWDQQAEASQGPARA
jgi:GDPmannose 4,6-dehydratase